MVLKTLNKRSRIAYRTDEVVYVLGFADIEKDDWYFKLGRTTDITRVICNGIDVDVRREGQRTI